MPDDVIQLGTRRAARAGPVPVTGFIMVGAHGTTDGDAVRTCIDMITREYADGDEARVTIAAITFGTEPDGRPVAYATFLIEDPPTPAAEG